MLSDFAPKPWPRGYAEEQPNMYSDSASLLHICKPYSYKYIRYIYIYICIYIRSTPYVFSFAASAPYLAYLKNSNRFGDAKDLHARQFAAFWLVPFAGAPLFRRRDTKGQSLSVFARGVSALCFFPRVHCFKARTVGLNGNQAGVQVVVRNQLESGRLRANGPSLEYQNLRWLPVPHHCRPEFNGETKQQHKSHLKGRSPELPCFPLGSGWGGSGNCLLKQCRRERGPLPPPLKGPVRGLFGDLDLTVCLCGFNSLAGHSSPEPQNWYVPKHGDPYFLFKPIPE